MSDTTTYPERRAGTRTRRRGAVVEYDFAAPARLSREHTRLLELAAMETAANAVTVQTAVATPVDPAPAERRTVMTDRLADLLAPLVARVDGAWLETKPASVAVHVRPVQDRAAAAHLLEEARRAVDSSLTLKPGKDVLEIAVTDAHKGAALSRLVDELGELLAQQAPHQLVIDLDLGGRHVRQGHRTTPA